MAQKFNPLLKIGLQEIGRDYSADISTLQNAINSLQSQANALQTALTALQGNKITKCFTAADLAKLVDNEIFEWQGASGTVDETAFVNGYFYKKTFLPSTVQVLILYHNYAYINGEYLADTYYYSHSEDPGLTQYMSTRNIDNKSVVWIGNSTPNVGDLVTISSGESSQSFVTITNKEIVDLQFQYTDSNGDVWSLNSSVYSRAITYNYYTNSQGVTINVNWDDFFDNMGFVCSDNGKLYLVRWTNYGSTGAKFDTVVNPEGSARYSATDTQSRLLNIENASNGDINITQNLNVSGDLNVTGSQRIVHTEKIDSENDYINLRYNNPLALANDEQSGIKVENYDGNNNNCIFGVDNAGWARIGDESGTLQKIATIEENPTDALFVQYDAQNKQLKTAAIPEATTTAAGLMSAADKIKLDGIAVNSIIYSFKADALISSDIYAICSLKSKPISFILFASGHWSNGNMGSFIVTVNGRANQSSNYQVDKIGGSSDVVNSVGVYWDSSYNAVLCFSTNVSSQSNITFLLFGFYGETVGFPSFTAIDRSIFSNNSIVTI